MSILLKAAAAVVAVLALYAAIVEGRGVIVAAGQNAPVPHGGLLGVMVRLLVAGLFAGGLAWGAQRLADPAGTRDRSDRARDLRDIYEREGLAARDRGCDSTNPYADVPTAELLDCYSSMDRSAHPERFDLLLAAIRQRVRASDDPRERVG